MSILFKQRPLLFAALFITLIFAGCASPPVNPEYVARGDYESMKQYITQKIQYEMKKHKVVGLSIALVDDQRIVWAQGFGYADIAKNIAATPTTVYRVGSISKLFTATAAMQLSEQGKFDIDQPLQTYLPQFSIKSRFLNAAPITPREIMTHHSGLPSDLKMGMWSEHPEPFTTVVDNIRDEYVAYPPNYVFSYSNLGFTLLGHAIQQVAKENFASYLDRSVLQPLGMIHSSFSERPDTPLMAKGYRDDKEMPEPALRDVPAGGLNSNVLDLSRFLQMIFAHGRSGGRQILKEETVVEMLRPQNTDIPLDAGFQVGLGWMMGWIGGGQIKNAGPVVHHNGATILYRSELIALPEHKLGVVVLANSTSAGQVVNDIATATLALALEVKSGIKQPKRLKPDADIGKLSQQELQSFPGFYATSFGFVRISESDGRLQTDVFGKRLDLVSCRDGLLCMQYKPLGIFPIKIEALSEFGLSRASISGHEVLLAQDQGQRFLLGEKITPSPVPESWLRRVGEYKIVNADGDFLAGTLKKINLVYRNGFLIVKLSTREGTITAAIKPISDTEALYRGVGRGMQETIQVKKVDGQEQLMSSGYILKRIADLTPF